MDSISINAQTTVKFEGFDDNCIQFSYEKDQSESNEDSSDQGKKFRIKYRLRENIKASDIISCRIDESSHPKDSNDDEETYVYSPEKRTYTFQPDIEAFYNDIYLDYYSCGYSNEDEVDEVEVTLKIEKCEKIDNAILARIADRSIMTCSTTKNEEIINENKKEYYVDYIKIKYRQDVKENKFILIYYDAFDNKAVHYIDMPYHAESQHDSFSLQFNTKNHEIAIDDLFDTRDYVATAFKFNGECNFRINDQTKCLQAINIFSDQLRNAELTNIQSSIPSKLKDILTVKQYSHDAFTVGQYMLNDYWDKYCKTLDQSKSIPSFDFIDNFFDKSENTKNKFIIYSDPHSTYRSIYDQVKNAKLDVELANDNDVIKFVGFIGLSDFRVSDNHYNNSVHSACMTPIPMAYDDYSDKDEMTYKLKDNNLVFMPCGEFIELFEDSDTNLDAQVNTYTTFYPVFLVRQRKVKLLNVGNNASENDFNIITDAVQNQIENNDGNIGFTESKKYNRDDFLTALGKASSECELLVINMMTNSYRDINQQCCAFRTASAYEMIPPSELNKCMFNSDARAIDFIYIAHCPYGGGTLTHEHCEYPSIMLPVYSSSSKSNVIGIAQYGATQGRLYLDKYNTDTFIVKSLIRKFCEEKHGTYSDFINQYFNPRTKTIRENIVDKIKNFAMSIQKIIIDNNSFSFDIDNESKKTFLLKFNDKSTIAREFSKNNDFINKPNDYLLDENKDPCMFQIFFACFTQYNFIKNIYLKPYHYITNVYLTSYRDIKTLHVTTETEDPNTGLEIIKVQAGYILSKITQMFSKYFKQLFDENSERTESYIRIWLKQAIEGFNNDVNVQVIDENIGDSSYVYYRDGIIYNLWKIYHRAIVPLFFTYTLDQINYFKDNNVQSSSDESLRNEYDRYIEVLNDIFIEAVMHIYNIYNLKSAISQIIGIKENDKIDIWELMFSIIPTSYPHAKVISAGECNSDFMNRPFLT